MGVRACVRACVRAFVCACVRAFWLFDNALFAWSDGEKLNATWLKKKTLFNSSVQMFSVICVRIKRKLLYLILNKMVNKI